MTEALAIAGAVLLAGVISHVVLLAFWRAWWWLEDQCGAAGMPFHFKQWGGRTPKAGGKSLDGREWCERPYQEMRDDRPRGWARCVHGALAHRAGALL